MKISKNNFSYGELDATYKAAGSLDGITQLVNDFYDIMSELPQVARIRNMHPSNLNNSREKLISFLSGWMGGPKLFQEKFGPIAIPKAHAHLPIFAEERDMWLLCMEKALEKQNYTQDFKDYLMEQLTKPANYILKACEIQRGE